MVSRNVKIQWTNKFSGETGYVKSILVKKGHFENTFDIEEAKKYSKSEALKAVSTLKDIGEAENNDFSLLFTP